MKGSTNGIIHRVRHLLGRADRSTDAELMARFIADRDADAFALLVRRHGPMVHGVCRRILRNAADADDAFQATFLLLARRARSVRNQRLLSNWLYGVAYRTALEARRAAAVRRVRERRAAEMKHSARSSPDTDPAAPDLREILDRELAALPDVYRTAIVLCDLEGLSRKDAAERLGWSEGTLSGRLFRARALLAARLARLGLALPAAGLGVVATASAAVPAALAESTVRIGVLVAAGEAVAVAAAPVAALMEGVMKAMLLTKLKGLATVVIISCAVLATTAAGWRANAVGASATVADGQSEPARRAAQRDPDKDRIAQLERERDELLRVVRELRQRLEKLEANRKPEVVEGEGLLLEKRKQLGLLAEKKEALNESLLEEAARKRLVEAQREKFEAERARARSASKKPVDGGPPAELAEKLELLRKMEEQLARRLKDPEKTREAIGDLADKLKMLELDAAKMAKMKALTDRDLAKVKEFAETRIEKVKDKGGDRVAALEDRVKAMEADLKKLIADLERQRKIK